MYNEGTYHSMSCNIESLLQIYLKYCKIYSILQYNE